MRGGPNLRVRIGDLAGLQYVGSAGTSASCHEAVRRFIQYGDRIVSARLLTCEQYHAFLLTLEPEEKIVVKSGFSSGYGGEGPRTLAQVLRLLDAFRVDIDECEIDRNMLDRLEVSALTSDDLERIEHAPIIRPQRWYDYIYDATPAEAKEVAAWRNLPPVMPWAIIDERIGDLALSFFDQPDEAILKGFRRLEESVRSRSGLHEHGAKLFSQAFQGDDAKLEWDVKDKAEQTGRAQLFSAAFMAFRNPRAHRELAGSSAKLLAEFLLLNQLFLLEAESVTHIVATPKN